MTNNVKLIDKCRAAFEESMSSQGEWPQAVERLSDGGYKLATTASAWEAWQDAWEAALQSQNREDALIEVMRITKREVEWNTAVRLSRCIMAMQDVSAVKESLTTPDGWQIVPIELTEDMSKAELIDLIEQQQQELEAIGAGGVSGKLMS